MAINVPYYDSYKISTTKDGQKWYDFGSGWLTCNYRQETYYDSLMAECRKRNYSPRKSTIDNYVCAILALETAQVSVVSVKNTDNISKEEKIGLIKNLINFFTEFHFEPNFRFVNTFAYQAMLGTQNEYVINYFKLSDSPYADSISEKMKSPEWESIVNVFKNVVPSSKINKRLKIYFGSQGTGKTTKACSETEGRCITCHSGILPADLMEDFRFNDGKAQFTPSAFCKAMTKGYAICLDEINLLPFDTIRFLQTILDGKSEFIYKGETIRIKEGFCVIGTMNLTVNGCTYSLPDPLIDRASDLVEFNLTAESLVHCISL